MPKFELVKAGDVLYDVGRQGGRVAWWPVEIISIDHAAGTAITRWNYNPPTVRYRRDIERYRRSPPKEKVSIRDIVMIAIGDHISGRALKNATLYTTEAEALADAEARLLARDGRTT